jgi:MFS family permease
LTRGGAFWLLGAVLGLLLFAAAAPSPMYVLYQARWGFSAATLTVVFAVYALAVLAALVAVGSLSDHLGRRPVLAAALLLEIAAMALFAAAGGVGWLYTARITQGLATGAALAVIGAALIDLTPPGRPYVGPLVNTIALSAGLGAGALGAGALVQYAPAPTLLTYVILLAIFAAAVLGTLLMPEPVTRRRGRWREALRPGRAAVPASIRTRFAWAATGLVASFALSGLYLSLGPSFAASVLQTQSHLLGGLVIFVLFAAGAACQLLLRSWPPRRAMLTGAVAILAGLGITNYALTGPSTAIFVIGGILLGAGFGLSLMGAYRILGSLAAPERRAEVMAAVYTVVYLSLGVPAVLAGLATTHYGLPTTMLVFSVGVAILAVLAAVGSRTTQLAEATPGASGVRDDEQEHHV